MTNIFRPAQSTGFGGRSGPNPPTSLPNFTNTRVADGGGAKGVARLTSIAPVFASAASTATPAPVGREPARHASKPQRGISSHSLFVMLLTPPRTSALARLALDHAPTMDQELGEDRHLIVFGDPRGSEKFGRDLLERLQGFGVKARAEWRKELERAGDIDTLVTRAVHTCAATANASDQVPCLLLWAPAIAPNKSVPVRIPLEADVDPALARELLDVLVLEVMEERISVQIRCDHFGTADFALEGCKSLAERLRSKFAKLQAGGHVEALHLSPLEFRVMEKLQLLGGPTTSGDLAKALGKDTVASTLSRLRGREMLDLPVARLGYVVTFKGVKATALARRQRDGIADRWKT